MENTLYASFTKQDEIVNQISNLFSHIIDSQEDQGDYVKFVLAKEHNLQEFGVIQISGVLDNADEEKSYNNSFKIYSIPDATSVVVKKSQEDFGVELEFNSSADFSNASLTNVRVYNDPGVEFPLEDYPVIVVDVDDTQVIGEAGNIFIPGQTMFPITVFHRLDNFPIDVNTQLQRCRYFVSYKLQEVLDLLQLKVISEVGRLETIWGSESVSVIGVTLIK